MPDHSAQPEPTRSPPALAAPDPSQLAWPERVALAVLLVLIALRAWMQESHTVEGSELTRFLAAPSGPQPATTLFFNGLIAAAAMLTFAARVYRGRIDYRWTGAEFGALMLVIAGIISASRAGQQRLALTGTINFLGMILLLLTLRQLLRTPACVRLALAVIVANGTVFAIRCGYQRAVDYPMTREYFEENRAAIVAAAGADSGKLHDFEQRLKSNAATGYFAHANVAGSYLVLTASAGLALVLDRLRRRPGNRQPFIVIPAVAAMGMSLALTLTQSKGAALSLLVAAVLTVLGTVLRAWFARHRRATAVLAWLAFFAILAAVVAWGLLHDGLPTRSMLFRWQYWRGAWAMWLDRGPLGVGADNFGRWFTRFKPAECPEEVQDPHSWIVRLGTEFGGLGLAGFLMLLVGVSWRLSRGPRAEFEAPGEDLTTGVHGASKVRIVPWALLLAAGIIVGWLFAYAGSDPVYILFALATPAIVWPGVCMLVAAESKQVGVFSDDSLIHAAPALIAGCAAFLLHSAVEVSLFMAGAATTFFALLAVCLAAIDGRLDGATSSPKARPIFAAAIVLGGIVALTLYATRIVRPVALATHHIEHARRLVASNRSAAHRASAAETRYRNAIDADPLDGAAVEELSSFILALARDVRDCGDALQLLALLRERDPQNLSVPRQSAAVYRIRFEIARDADDLERACSAVREWIAGYPTWPAAHLTLGRFLEELNAVRPSPRLVAEAIASYERGLELDRLRVYVSAPNRLSTERIRDAEAAIARLRGAQTCSASTRSS
ncbi:MAG: O-antigen ligase family protein [Phycisphaerae bacterium]|nr:O-antigen ligase family protein [Phycisphaerae bacterium]